jgi:hypothetical protein
MKTRVKQPHDRTDMFLAGTLMAVLLFLLCIALKALPSNTDSLFYRMSRVMHWMQNKDLAHYATQYQVQLRFPPLAEFFMLHLRILAENDQYVNVVQWCGMVASLVGVTLIARLLGAGTREQYLAGFFVVSIPVGILQSTSTQNDYVVTFWLVCTALFVILSKENQLKRGNKVYLMLSAALGILTKHIYVFYALPLLLWYFLPGLSRRRFGSTLKDGFAFASITILFNAGWWLRNLVTYGSLIGSVDAFGKWVHVSLDPRVWTSSVLRHTLLNFVSTIPKFNNAITGFVELCHEILRIELHDYVLIPGWNHEDLAGNPLHTLLVLFTLILIGLLYRKTASKITLKFAAVLLLGFFLVSTLFTVSPYYIRFQLPFLVLWGSIFALVATHLKLGKWTRYTALLLLVSSIPWLLFNSTRSVLAVKPYTRMGGSIFHETTEAILFANWHHLIDPYKEAAEIIVDQECKQVGLRIDSHDIEYPFWRLIEAPESGIRIDAVDQYPYLERYFDPSYQPCVLICSLCGDREEILGLHRYRDLGEGFVIFLKGSE